MSYLPPHSWYMLDQKKRKTASYEPADREVIGYMFRKKALTQNLYDPLFETLAPLFEINETGRISLDTQLSKEPILSDLLQPIDNPFSLQTTPELCLVSHLRAAPPALESIRLETKTYWRYGDQLRSLPPAVLRLLRDDDLDERWRLEISLFANNLHLVYGWMADQGRLGPLQNPSLADIVGFQVGIMVAHLFWTAFMGDRDAFERLQVAVRWLPFLVPIGGNQSQLWCLAG